MKIIFFFDSHDLPSLDQAGGKALSLIQMTQAGMAVPPGFVLTVQFFAPWLEVVTQSPAWRTLLQADVSGDASELEQAAKELQELCRHQPWHETQQAEVASAMNALQAEHSTHLYAVRSSSPEEDLEGASFAGGYETSLGVTAETLQTAIRHSFASSFDQRVFLYKKEHGFRLDQPRIAVIVQQQIDAECAGVAFSLNPLNNCYDEAVINANYGLGESVVSGKADPDFFVVDKVKREIIESRIGRKATVVTLNQTGGTRQSSRANQPESSLTPVQVLEVTDLLAGVEAHYHKPVDIEWAISGGKLFLLQARPITTYLPLPDEMVTAPGQPKRLYANSTLIEQGLQEPLSVLGTDFTRYVLEQVGGPIARGAIGLDGITFTARGGYYMNLSYAMKVGMRNAGLAPGSFGDPRILAILDSIDMKQYLAVELPKKFRFFPVKTLVTMLPTLKSILFAYLWPERTLQRYKDALPQAVRRFERFAGDTPSLTSGSLQEYAIEVTKLLCFFYEEHGIPMILAGQLAQQRIKGLFKAEAKQVQDHLTNLGVSLPGNKTAEMGAWMVDLASSDEIKRYDAAPDFLAALERGKLSLDFVRRWQHFMTEFGARCPVEIDPATPRPKEQPGLVFEQLKTMSLASHHKNGGRSFFEESSAKREAAYQALYDIALKKGKKKAKALEGYYKTWLTFGGYRETPKHYIIQVVDLFRRRALAIAQTFVASGRLDSVEQIFDLTIEDIDHAHNDPTLDLRAIGQERSALIHKIRKSKLVARIIDSRGKIFYPPHTAHADGEWIGVPISPGVVQGRVKVLHHPHEKKLLPGEILVARSTDPGWTPLFLNAKGIILEIGGALQHGAVVAREYGIPCVSGVDEATNRLKDGQWVEVDGSNGVVRVVEKEANG